MKIITPEELNDFEGKDILIEAAEEGTKACQKTDIPVDPTGLFLIGFAVIIKDLKKEIQELKNEKQKNN